MKIGLVIEHFDETRGGAQRLAVWMARELASRGHDVHVVCHDVAVRVGRFRAATLRASFDPERSRHGHSGETASDPTPRKDDTGRVHIHRLRGMRLNTAFGFRLFGVRARRWFREHGADVVHSLTVACPGDIYHAHTGLYAAMQAQAAASRHTDAAAAWKRVLLRLPGKQRTLVALEREALQGRRAAKLVIGPCAMTAREVKTFYPAAAGKVEVLDAPHVDLPPGIPASATAAARREAELRAWFRGHYGIADTQRVAIFVGHDFRREGLRYAIEAVARTRDWHLLVVGQGRVREFVELARELGVGLAEDAATPHHHAAARVKFLGPTGEMETLYAAADALLLPTFYEPSGLVSMEALAAGLPVVSTAHLGISELILKHHVGAIVTSPRDVDALARALDALPRPPTLHWQELRTRARRAGQGVSAAAYVATLERLYSEVSIQPRRGHGM